jgi:hypothetical protein
MAEKESAPRTRVFPPNIRLLGWVSLLNDIASEMIFPLLPLFLVQDLHVSRTFLGLMEGVSESATSFLKFFAGWFPTKSPKESRCSF